MSNNFNQNKSHNYWKILSDSSVPPLFDRYSNTKEKKDAIEICSKFLHLGDETFIEFVRDLFNPKQKKVKVGFTSNVLEQHIKKNELIIIKQIGLIFGVDAIKSGLIGGASGVASGAVKLAIGVGSLPLQALSSIGNRFSQRFKLPGLQIRNAAGVPGNSNYGQQKQTLNRLTTGFRLFARGQRKLQGLPPNTKHELPPPQNLEQNRFSDSSVPPNFINSDTKVQQNTDSSYTSHLGAIGANGNHQGGHPMNMTHRFP